MTEATEFTNEHGTFKSFHVGDILSITTGVLVSPRGIGGVYDILGFMTGETLMTHQLLRASGQCKPVLLEMYPGIAQVEVPSTDGIPEGWQTEFWQNWLAERVLEFGETLPVPKLVNHTAPNPIKEFVEVMGAYGNDSIIIVVPDKNEETDGS